MASLAINKNHMFIMISIICIVYYLNIDSQVNHNIDKIFKIYHKEAIQIIKSHILCDKYST